MSGGGRAQAGAMDQIGERVAVIAESGDWPQVLAASLDPHSNDKPDAAAGNGASPYSTAGPLAVRVAAVKIPPAASLVPLSQGEPQPTAASVVWFRCPAGSAGGEELDPRWMMWGIEPTQDAEPITARHRELAGLLARTDAPEQAWLWRGVVRPTRVLEVLPAPLAFAAGLSGAGAVKELRVESWEEEASNDKAARMRGRVVIEWSVGTEPKR